MIQSDQKKETMSMKNTKILGYDPGFGNSKAAMIDPLSGIKVASIPSVVGVGSTEIGMLDSSIGSNGKRNLPYRVDFGVQYLVGENVELFTIPAQRLDFRSLAEGPEVRASFYACLHKLKDDEAGEAEASGEIEVMVGLPVVVMRDKQLAKRTRKELRKWMVGQHHFTVDGIEHDVKVSKVDVMPQPAGAYFGWGMGLNGRWSRDPALLKNLVAVCDIGFNTTDLFVLKGGKVIPRYTAGNKMGVRRGAEQLASLIGEQTGINLSLHEADAYLRGGNPEISTSSGLVDLGPLVAQAKDSVVANVAQFVERSWGDGKRFSHILFVGGGASLLRAEMAHFYPHGITLPGALTANAEGLAKFGVRSLLK